VKHGALLFLAGLVAPAAATGQAPELADPTVLVDFIKLQDSAVTAEEATACAADAAQARITLHKKYDPQLLGIIRWLQDRYSDDQLREADAQVHADWRRTPVSCPMTGDEIAAKEQAYAEALTSLEARTREGAQQP
jgi:hypothetical protein